jgi:hypothetical protein
MTDVIKTQSQLQTLFADGQATGSLTPNDVRDIIVSVPTLAGTKDSGLLYAVGSVSGTATFNWANGALQTATLTLSSACTFTIPAQNLGTVSSQVVFARLVLYITNNSSGNGVITWPGNVNWVGSSPQPNPIANGVTKFNLESLDGGNTWSITF